LDVSTEREAQKLKGTAKIVQALEPEMQQAVAQYLKTVTSSERPTTLAKSKRRWRWRRPSIYTTR